MEAILGMTNIYVVNKLFKFFERKYIKKNNFGSERQTCGQNHKNSKKKPGSSRRIVLFVEAACHDFQLYLRITRRLLQAPCCRPQHKMIISLSTAIKNSLNKKKNNKYQNNYKYE
jgi:hypothetical protein